MPLQLASDVKATKDKLAGYIDAKANVAAYVLALQSTDISGVNFKTLSKDLQDKLPENPATLLATVGGYLTTAKTHGQNWSNNIQPGLTAIPQAVINYNATFQEVIKIMIPLVTDLSINPDNSQERTEVMALFKGLLGKLGEQQTNMNAEIALLKQFNTDVTTDHNNFSSGNTSFNVIKTFEESTIKALKSAISGFEDAISALNKAITAESVALGVSIGLIAGGGAMLATSETGVGLIAGAVVMVVGMVGVGVAAGELISSIEKKQDAQQKEAFDQLEVDELTVQVQALDTVETALSALVTKSQTAMQSVQVILDTFATLEGKLEAVIADLNDSEKAIGDIMSLVDLNTASDQWGQLDTFATQMQDFESVVYANPPVTVPMKPLAVKIAA